MRSKLLFALLICLYMAAYIPVGSAASEEQVSPEKERTFYVRQTVGDDSNDGLSPQTAWQHISKLSTAMQAGDTAYIGPGLYREQVVVKNNGTPDKWLTFIADSSGQHTGDPPGIVMITGAEPINKGIFVSHSVPGVYVAKFSAYRVIGVVEMDGDQYRYSRARDTREHLIDKLSELEVVAKIPSSYFYDEKAKVLYLHTSDGKPPSNHEIELILRGNGIFALKKHFIKIIGFTFRHFGDGGINFFKDSSHGIAINNTSYGSRQGIRVYTATDILVYGNTLFRNENCGVYFAARSDSGLAIGNIAYENIKGIRVGSDSVFMQAVDNMLFDNKEQGISIEETNRVLLRRNLLLNNKISQLLVLKSEYDSDDNCFENGTPGQFIADFYPFPPSVQLKTLADYQKAKHQDLHSREGNCGPLPAKIDVRKLHEETMGYAEKARKILGESRTRQP